MIIIALGSNINGPWGTPRDSILRALLELDRGPLHLMRTSTLLDTDPYGRKNQPRYVNAAVVIETHLPPDALLRRLHAIERAGGRKRALRWGPRTIDLDIIDYHGLVSQSGASLLHGVTLPHPGIAMRRFVLEPLAEIAPRWRHPQLHMTAAQLLARLHD